jgi:hypothetical protein
MHSKAGLAVPVYPMAQIYALDFRRKTIPVASIQNF